MNLDISCDYSANCSFCHKVKFRKCHRNVFVELNNIKKILIYDLNQLITSLTVNPAFQLPKSINS